jgi:ABC-type Fe3+-hydroxamate transport system substrate-binding protein
MTEYIDQMGYSIQLTKIPQRIVSLVPSQTELLFDLGLDNRIIGITNFCVHPKEKLENFPRIGGNKRFLFDKIAQLQPDLIIGNKEVNYLEGIEKLRQHYPVWLSDVKTLEDTYHLISELANMFMCQEKGQLLIQKIQNEFAQLPEVNLPSSVAYFVWRKPWMVAGKDTFIDYMLKKAGFRNAFSDFCEYPKITLEQLKAANPQILLLTSEPFPFKDKHIDELKSILPESKPLSVDGQLFSWFGSRIQYSPKYFQDLRSII